MFIHIVGGLKDGIVYYRKEAWLGNFYQKLLSIYSKSKDPLILMSLTNITDAFDERQLREIFNEICQWEYYSGKNRRFKESKISHLPLEVLQVAGKISRPESGPTGRALHFAFIEAIELKKKSLGNE